MADLPALAAAAATRAGVTIVDGPALSIDALADLAHLFDRVWGRDVTTMGSIVTREILWATAHVGSQVTAAFRSDRLVAGTVAFLGLRDGTPLLHSHLTGVLPDHVGEGIGRALKSHQAAWCRARGVPTVEWTFDPLVRRNAVFNLVRLGARPTAFLPDLYGAMADARNAQMPSDRFVARWDLDDPRVQHALAGRGAQPRVDALRRTGATVVLDAREDGHPVVTPSEAPRRLAHIPADIERLRAEAPGLARAWTDAFREAVGAAIERGDRVTGITRDGWYVLGRNEATTELADP